MIFKPVVGHMVNNVFQLGDLHPILNHFPIVLFFVALAFDFLSILLKKDSLLYQSHWIVIIAAFLTIPTVITGFFAIDLGHQTAPYLHVHRNWGLITVLYSCWHAFFRIYVIKKRKTVFGFVFLMMSLINVGLISITAEYGSTITRGKGLWIHHVHQAVNRAANERYDDSNQ